MKTKTLIIITTLTLSIMLSAANGFADVPAPPVNQEIGMLDVSIGSLEEADCRICHDSGVPDRHHMQYGSVIPPLTLVPYPDSDGDGVDDTNYSCLSCHDSDFNVVRDCTVCHNTTSPHHQTALANAGDCVACHGDVVDNMDDGHYIPTYSPSLVTPLRSQGAGLPLNSEGNGAGACNYCHDNDNQTPPVILDNHDLHHGINLVDFGSRCDWCHLNYDFLNPTGEQTRTCENCHGMESLHNIQADSTAAANIGTIVVGEEDYGYGHIGIDDPRRGGTCSDNSEACSSDADCTQGSTGTCNASSCGEALCDNADNQPCSSDADCTIIGATCDPIGEGSDCWGCHGFGFASTSAPGAGPVTPSLNDSSEQVIVAGTDTEITLSCSSLTSTSRTTEFVSTFKLSSKNGTGVEITPEQINAFSSTIIIPGTTAPGNYLLTAVKNNGAAISNPLSISIKPLVNIGEISGDCSSELTIKGSGFGDTPPEGTVPSFTVMQNDVSLNITTWTDTLITATGAACDGSPITVNGLYGSATK